MKKKPTVEEVLERFKGRPVADLEAAYRARLTENNDIQAQLGNRNRTHPDGTRFSDHEYHQWRNRATFALRHGLEEQRVLKEALKVARRRFNTDTPLRPAMTLKTPDELIHAAYVVLHKLACEVDVDDEEQQVIDALDTYLRTHGKVGA